MVGSKEEVVGLRVSILLATCSYLGSQCSGLLLGSIYFLFGLLLVMGEGTVL